MCFSNHERHSLVAVKLSISRARTHGECSVRDRHKRMVGFIESAMPADGIPRCHSPRTETSARPVSKSSSKEDYRIPRPSKRPSYWPGCRTNNPVKTSAAVRVMMTTCPCGMSHGDVRFRILHSNQLLPRTMATCRRWRKPFRGHHRLVATCCRRIELVAGV